MNKICTSIEQSERLIELGIDINTADMCWSIDIPDLPTLLAYPITECDNWENKIPAWSLSALISLMPFQYIENNNRFGFYQVKGLNEQGETYRFGYKTNNNSFLFETSWHNDIVDAAFEMVCWLKENKKI